MGIPTVKLNFKPYAKRTTDEIADKVPRDNVKRIEKAMDRKIQKNAWEQEDHSGAGNFVVKEDGEER